MFAYQFISGFDKIIGPSVTNLPFFYKNVYNKNRYVMPARRWENMGCLSLKKKFYK